jgi:hypothetical protein
MRRLGVVNPGLNCGPSIAWGFVAPTRSSRVGARSITLAGPWATVPTFHKLAPHPSGIASAKVLLIDAIETEMQVRKVDTL